MRSIARILLAAIFGACWIIAVPAAQVTDFAPVGLTSSVEKVPTLNPISLSAPYRLAWEKRLQAFETTFEAKLAAQGTTIDIDPIETGSISAAR